MNSISIPLSDTYLRLLRKIRQVHDTRILFRLTDDIEIYASESSPYAEIRYSGPDHLYRVEVDEQGYMKITRSIFTGCKQYTAKALVKDMYELFKIINGHYNDANIDTVRKRFLCFSF